MKWDLVHNYEKESAQAQLPREMRNSVPFQIFRNGEAFSCVKNRLFLGIIPQRLHPNKFLVMPMHFSLGRYARNVL